MPVLEVIRGDIREPGSLRFRNKPSAPCILQYSTDAGSSWRDGFNFDLCLGSIKRQTSHIWEITVGSSIVNNYDQIVNNYTTNNDMSVFAPQMVYTGISDADGWRDTALCQAVRDMVDFACSYELKQRQSAANTGNILGTIGEILGAGGGSIVGLAIKGKFAMWLGIGGMITGLLSSMFAGLSANILERDDLRSAVACCLYCAIKGQTPSKAAFQAGLSSCDFPFGSGEAQLAGAIDGLLDRDDVFSTFVKAAEDNIRAAQLGLIECPCACGEFKPFLWDFGSGFAPNPPAITQGFIISYSSLSGMSNSPERWGYAILEIEVNATISKIEPFVWFNAYGRMLTRISIDGTVMLEHIGGNNHTPIPVTWIGSAFARIVKVEVWDEANGGWAGIRRIEIS